MDDYDSMPSHDDVNQQINDTRRDHMDRGGRSRRSTSGNRGNPPPDDYQDNYQDYQEEGGGPSLGEQMGTPPPRSRGSQRNNENNQQQNGQSNRGNGLNYDQSQSIPSTGNKAVDILMVGAAALGFAKLAQKILPGGDNNTNSDNSQQRGGRGNRGGNNQNQSRPMSMGERLAMIVIAMTSLIIMVSFGTYMVNNGIKSGTQRAEEGFREVTSNIYKGGTIEGINNPNKQIFTETKKVMEPYTYEKNDELLIRGKHGNFTIPMRTIPPSIREQAQESGYLYVNYTVEPDTGNVIQRKFDSFAEKGGLADSEFVFGEDGQVIDVRKTRVKEDDNATNLKELTQEEYDQLSEIDKKIYDVQRAEVNKSKNTNVKQDTPTSQAQNNTISNNIQSPKGINKIINSIKEKISYITKGVKSEINPNKNITNTIPNQPNIQTPTPTTNESHQNINKNTKSINPISTSPYKETDIINQQQQPTENKRLTRTRE